MRFRTFSVFFFLFIFLLSSLALVSAIGVSPPRHDVNFAPGLERTFSYMVTNNRPHPINARITIEGEEGKAYLTASDKLVPLSALGAGNFEVTAKLPESFEKPGWHELTVIVQEDFQDNNAKGSFPVRTASVVPVRVFVPYDGYYVDMKVTTRSVPEGEQPVIEVALKNEGTLDHVDATLNILIEDLEGNLVDEWTINGINIASKASDKYMRLGSYDLAPGKYYVKTTYIFGDKQAFKEKDFKIGSKEVHPLSVTDYLPIGRVAPFEIKVESYWNEKIPSVYASVTIQGKTGTSSPMTLEAFGKDRLTGFIDLTDVKIEGMTTATVHVYFDGFQTKETFEVELYKEPEPIIEAPKEIIEISNNIIIFTMVLLTLIIVAMIIILTGRKGKHHDHEKKEKF